MVKKAIKTKIFNMQQKMGNFDFKFLISMI